MTRVPILAAALAAVLCVAVGTAAAQDWRRHGDPAEPRRDGYPQAPGPQRGEGRPDPGFGPYRGLPPSYAPPPYLPPPSGRAPPPIAAWRNHESEPVGQAPPRNGHLDSIIENLGRRIPGRQLNSDVGYQDGRTVYRVVWITVHGQRIDFVIDAASGRILSER